MENLSVVETVEFKYPVYLTYLEIGRWTSDVLLYSVYENADRHYRQTDRVHDKAWIFFIEKQVNNTVVLQVHTWY